MKFDVGLPKTTIMWHCTETVIFSNTNIELQLQNTPFYSKNHGSDNFIHIHIGATILAFCVHECLVYAITCTSCKYFANKI